MAFVHWGLVVAFCSLDSGCRYVLTLVLSDIFNVSSLHSYINA